LHAGSDLKRAALLLARRKKLASLRPDFRSDLDGKNLRYLFPSAQEELRTEISLEMECGFSFSARAIVKVRVH